MSNKKDISLLELKKIQRDVEFQILNLAQNLYDSYGVSFGLVQFPLNEDTGEIGCVVEFILNSSLK